LVALARARLEGTPLSAAALLDAGWPGEEKASDRFRLTLKARSASLNRAGNRLNRGVLSKDNFLEVLLKIAK
jgi:hypothetical protein